MFDPHLIVVQQYIVDGTNQGLDLSEIQKALAVEFAIQSGDVPLPWSQEEVEETANDHGPYLHLTQSLMATHPEFTLVAAKWAYAQSRDLFYTLTEYVHQ